MADWSSALSPALAAVAAATRLVRTRPPASSSPKDDRDMATDVDLAVERGIRAELAVSTPSIDLLGEEEGRSGTDGGGLHWVLDPIDGTVNFLHGLPLCAVSLALVDDGEPVVGVVTLPFLGLTYHATQGGGTHRDGRPVRCSRVTDLAEAVVSIGDYAVDRDAQAKNTARFAVTRALAAQVQRVRMLGAAAIDLAWVADGRLDASIMLSNKPWDTAAGVLLAREAGALVLDDRGRRHDATSRSVVAVTPGLSDALVDLVATAADEP